MPLRVEALGDPYLWVHMTRMRSPQCEGWGGVAGGKAGGGVGGLGAGWGAIQAS
jgi:hypothetical protein